MKLFTSLGIKVNVIKLTDVFTNAHEWDPHSFMIDNIPMTAFTAPAGKASQYRFMWNGQYYRVSKKVIEGLPEGERMTFFTVDPTIKAQEVKKKISRVEGKLFITIIQFPDIKGLFVGTVLRAFIDDNSNAICNVKNNEVIVSKDQYRYASNTEIFSYFASNFNKLVFVKINNNDTGEIRELVTIFDAPTGGIFVRTSNKQVEKKAIAISYVYDPTDEQLLQYYVDDAVSKQCILKARVNYHGNHYDIKEYKLNNRKQFEVILDRDGKIISAFLKDISLVHVALPTSNGLDLANYFIGLIDKKDFLVSLDDEVRESFFTAIKNWSITNL